MQYWLIKSEPETFSYDALVKKGREHWDGVRNYQARNNLATMLPGDLCLFYHSVSEKAVVGIAEVVSLPYPDPTTDDIRWVCVDVAPHTRLAKPISLDIIKSTPSLEGLLLIRHSRLSVMPVSKEHFDIIVALGH
jgi:predicted RNA-binding protein with PUA-like domain